MKPGGLEASAEHAGEYEGTLEKLKQLGIRDPEKFLGRLHIYILDTPAEELTSRARQGVLEVAKVTVRDHPELVE